MNLDNYKKTGIIELILSLVFSLVLIVNVIYIGEKFINDEALRKASIDGVAALSNLGVWMSQFFLVIVAIAFTIIAIISKLLRNKKGSGYTAISLIFISGIFVFDLIVVGVLNSSELTEAGQFFRLAYIILPIALALIKIITISNKKKINQFLK